MYVTKVLTFFPPFVLFVSAPVLCSNLIVILQLIWSGGISLLNDLLSPVTYLSNSVPDDVSSSTYKLLVPFLSSIEVIVNNVAQIIRPSCPSSF